MAKTESKGKAAGSALLPTVSPEKIVKGMTTIFQGFSIMFDGMAEQYFPLIRIWPYLCEGFGGKRSGKTRKDKKEVNMSR